jgi:hypothetical protein
MTGQERTLVEGVVAEVLKEMPEWIERRVEELLQEVEDADEWRRLKAKERRKRS